MSTQKKSLISQHTAVKKANLANATSEKPSVSAPISGSVKPRLAHTVDIRKAAISRVKLRVRAL